MVGLPCLVNQCAKLHAAGWTWAVFIRVYLESCTWHVAIFTMDQSKEQTVCSSASTQFWLSSPTHRTPQIWHPVTFSYFKKWNWSWKNAGLIPMRRSESQRMLDTDRKGLPGSVPKLEETVAPVSTCGRELLRGWRRPIGLMVSFIIFTASVRNILDTTS
jgi:hypothetical protein